MRGTKLRVLVWFAVISALAPIEQVSAQVMLPVRIRLDPSLIEYSFSATKNRQDGITVRNEVQGVEAGMYPSNLFFGIGGSVANRFNLGLSILISVEATKTKTRVDGVGSDAAIDAGSNKATATNIWLVPYLEGVFGVGQKDRAFFGGHVGMGTSTVVNDDDKSVTGVIFVGGVSAGLHYFLNEHVSLDPHLRLLYSIGEIDSVTVRGFTAALVLGISAWVGTPPVLPVSADAPTTGDPNDPAASLVVAEPAKVVAAPSRSKPNTAARTIDIGDLQLDLLAQRQYPNAIAVRLRRISPPERSASMQCGTWTFLAGDARVEVASAKYAVVPEAAGVRETLKGHLSMSALHELADHLIGQGLSALDVCGARVYLSGMNRSALLEFHDQVVELFAEPTVVAAEETEPPPSEPASTTGSTAPSEADTLSQAPAPPEASAPPPESSVPAGP